MKNLLSATLGAGALFTFVTACHHEPMCDLPPCPSGTVALDSVRYWNGSPACFGPRVEQVGQFQTYVINSQAELQAIKGCADAIQVDFSRYTLLAGKTKTVACNYVTSQRAEYTCEGLIYHVVVAPGMCQTPSEAVYAVVVPKQPANMPVRFDVQVQ